VWIKFKIQSNAGRWGQKVYEEGQRGEEKGKDVRIARGSIVQILCKKGNPTGQTVVKLRDQEKKA